MMPIEKLLTWKFLLPKDFADMKKSDKEKTCRKSFATFYLRKSIVIEKSLGEIRTVDLSYRLLSQYARISILRESFY